MISQHLAAPIAVRCGEQRCCAAIHGVRVKVVRVSPARRRNARGGLELVPVLFHRGPRFSQNAGLNQSFDEDAARLYRSIVSSSIPGAHGGTMFVKVAQEDLWHTGNSRSNRIAYARYDAMPIRLAFGYGNLRSLQRGRDWPPAHHPAKTEDVVVAATAPKAPPTGLQQTPGWSIGSPGLPRRIHQEASVLRRRPALRPLPPRAQPAGPRREADHHRWQVLHSSHLPTQARPGSTPATSLAVDRPREGEPHGLARYQC